MVKVKKVIGLSPKEHDSGYLRVGVFRDAQTLYHQNTNASLTHVEPERVYVPACLPLLL